jgi:hypothetical protein
MEMGGDVARSAIAEPPLSEAEGASPPTDLPDRWISKGRAGRLHKCAQKCGLERIFSELTVQESER